MTRRSPYRGLAQAINDLALWAKRPWHRRIGQAMRRLMRLTGDPPVTITVGGFDLLAPLSHELGHYQRDHHQYGRNIGVLAGLISEAESAATMVDVGANIGDTAATARRFAPDLPILCIEGSPSFAPLLRVNLSGWHDVEIVAPCFVGDQAGQVQGQLSHAGGTASFERLASADTSVSTLDDLLASYPRFMSPSLLKIDTDGFDAKVLTGATRTLMQSQTVLFVEYDPTLLAKYGSSGLAMMSTLRELGYGPAVSYDNYGYPVCRLDIANLRLLEDLDRYAGTRPSFYYDVAIFPLARSALADELYNREVETVQRLSTDLNAPTGHHEKS